MNDDLETRGCAFGLLVGMFLWITFFVGAAILVAALVR